MKNQTEENSCRASLGFTDDNIIRTDEEESESNNELHRFLKEHLMKEIVSNLNLV